MRVWGGFDEVRTRLRNQALLFFWFEEAKHFFHFFFPEIISTFFCAKHIVLPLSYFFVCRESSSYKLGTFEVLQDCSGFGLAPFQSLGKVAVSTCFFFFSRRHHAFQKEQHTRAHGPSKRSENAGRGLMFTYFYGGQTLTTSLPGWLTTAPSPVIPKVPDTPPHAGLEHPLPKGHVRHAVPHKSADLDGGGGWILRQQFFPQHVRARVGTHLDEEEDEGERQVVQLQRRVQGEPDGA